MADVLFMNTNAAYEAKGDNNKSQEWSTVQVVMNLTEQVYGHTHLPSHYRFDCRRLLTITLKHSRRGGSRDRVCEGDAPSTFSMGAVVLFLVASVAPVHVIVWA